MKYSDLSYLIEYSSNDNEFVKEMVALFVENTPGFLQEMRVSFSKEDYTALGKIAHKIKPSMTFMGIPNGKNLTADLENECQNALNPEQIKVKMDELIAICSKAIAELELKLKDL